MRHLLITVAVCALFIPAAAEEREMFQPTVELLITLPLQDHAPKSLMLNFDEGYSVEDALLALGPKAEIVRFFMPVPQPLDTCNGSMDCADFLTAACGLVGTEDIIEASWGKNSCRATCANDYKVAAACDADRAVNRFEELEKIKSSGLYDVTTRASVCSSSDACAKKIGKACGACVDFAAWEKDSTCTFQCCGGTPNVTNCQ